MTPPADDLFGADAAPETKPRGDRPLADRLRPRTLDEVVGQDHLLGPDGALTGMLARGSLASMILWGPPGIGKTTIARLLAVRAGLHFVQLSAVFSGVADLKKAFDEAARSAAGWAGDPAVRRRDPPLQPRPAGRLSAGRGGGDVTLVGATTENPSFELNGALLSRCQVLVLRRLDDAALDLLLARAESD